MKKFICPEVPDEGFMEAEDRAEAEFYFECKGCGGCDGGPVEYKDKDDVAAGKAETCAERIRKIAESPRIEPHMKRVLAADTLCALLRELGYHQPVEAYEAILKLTDA